MKRTERHHLKEDQMAHGLQGLVKLAQGYRREIGVVVAAIVFAAAVFSALLVFRAHARNVKSRAIAQVGALAAEVDTNPDKLADLEKLAEKGRAARLANIELAKYWAERGDWDKAASYVDRIPGGPKDLLYYQAEHLKARIALSRKDFDRAIAIYAKIRDEKPEVYPLDAALFQLAECHELKGDTEAALEIYRTLRTDYPQSYYGYEASLKVGKLEVRK
jgi:TolA-binding protein